MTVNLVREIDDRVPIRLVLVSVSDKKGLEDLVPALVEVNPEVRIISTGGTYRRLSDILGETKSQRHLGRVSEFTGQPETQGGLVKTLDFKLYLGLLSETYNDAHKGDLARTGSMPIDMVVCNLYPFARTVAREGVTVEEARANVDIGGPSMIRAAAKNFLRVASVVDPEDYPSLIEKLKESEGTLGLETRFELARKAFRHTADYDSVIAEHFGELDLGSARSCYTIVEDDR
jgi:phosphoribosylaminoimidazolecarboxamide formyltransferase/IMP cyclohydrolase